MESGAPASKASVAIAYAPGAPGRYEEMVDAMKDEAAKAKGVMNDGLDKDTRYGPINNRMQLARVSRFLRFAELVFHCESIRARVCASGRGAR